MSKVTFLFPKLHLETVILQIHRNISSKYCCKLLILGGGTGGCSIAAKFSRVLKENEIIVVEQCERHYYQPGFTFIGIGQGQLSKSWKLMKDVLPKNVIWIKDIVTSIDPDNNLVITKRGCQILYEFLIISLGLDLNFGKIRGLVDALCEPEVCSIYSVKYVTKTFEAIKRIDRGTAIFTHPRCPIKCQGASQKIAYLCDHYLRKVKRRECVKIIYNTANPDLFAVRRYSNVLWEVTERRDIQVNLKTNLIEVHPSTREAVFEKDKKTKVFKYDFLHVTPYMKPPAVLRATKSLVDKNGYVKVNKHTLAHVDYPNVFAIGDCCNAPNSKTAAAVAVQSYVVFNNLKACMLGKDSYFFYNGYSSCPIFTEIGKCVMAEFLYNGVPFETFPFKQDKERYSMYYGVKLFMPTLYWKFMMNGRWNGPSNIRKIFHPFQQHQYGIDQ